MHDPDQTSTEIGTKIAARHHLMGRPFAPLLEEKRHAGCVTLIAQRPPPLGVHRPRTGSALATADHPIDRLIRRAIWRRIESVATVDRTKHRLDADIANSCWRSTKMFATLVPSLLTLAGDAKPKIFQHDWSLALIGQIQTTIIAPIKSQPRHK